MKKKNPVNRFAKEGERGKGEQKPKKKYTRHDRRRNKDVNDIELGDSDQ